jgi:hypothetical protein
MTKRSLYFLLGDLCRREGVNGRYWLENLGRVDTRKSEIHGVPNLSVGFLFHKGCIKFIKFKYIYILFSVSIHLNLDKFQAIFMKRRKYQIMITEEVVCS